MIKKLKLGKGGKRGGGKIQKGEDKKCLIQISLNKKREKEGKKKRN